MRRILPMPVPAMTAVAACTADAADERDPERMGSGGPADCGAELVHDLSTWAEAGFNGSIAAAA